MGKKKKKKEMTSFAAAFKDAGLLSDKKADKLMRQKAHEERVKGRDKVAEEEAEKQKQWEQERERQRQEAQQQQEQHEAVERQARAEKLVAAGRMESRGRKKFFFITRDNRIPYLEIGNDAARMLESGDAAIVESFGVTRDSHLILRGRDAIRALRAVDEEAVRFWNQ